MSTRLTELIQPNDLQGDLRLICDACGIEVVRSLLENCSGVTFYIPSATAITPLLKRYIDNRFEGRPPKGELEIKVLAVELSMSTASIRSLIKRIYS